MCGERGQELGSPHLCTHGPWLHGPSPHQPAGALQPAKVTLSFLPLPSWELGGGLDARGERHGSHTASELRDPEELNGRKTGVIASSFCLQNIKRPPEPMVWTAQLPHDCFLLSWKYIYKRLFPGLAPLEAVHLRQPRTAVLLEIGAPGPGGGGVKSA